MIMELTAQLMLNIQIFIKIKNIYKYTIKYIFKHA